jgi:hypothetical protein
VTPRQEGAVAGARTRRMNAAIRKIESEKYAAIRAAGDVYVASTAPVRDGINAKSDLPRLGEILRAAQTAYNDAAQTARDRIDVATRKARHIQTVANETAYRIAKAETDRVVNAYRRDLRILNGASS